jgi:hypothetical protein
MAVFSRSATDFDPTFTRRVYIDLIMRIAHRIKVPPTYDELKTVYYLLHFDAFRFGRESRMIYLVRVFVHRESIWHTEGWWPTVLANNPVHI